MDNTRLININTAPELMSMVECGNIVILWNFILDTVMADTHGLMQDKQQLEHKMNKLRKRHPSTIYNEKNIDRFQFHTRVAHLRPPTPRSQLASTLMPPGPAKQLIATLERKATAKNGEN